MFNPQGILVIPLHVITESCSPAVLVHRTNSLPDWLAFSCFHKKKKKGLEWVNSERHLYALLCTSHMCKSQPFSFISTILKVAAHSVFYWTVYFLMKCIFLTIKGISILCTIFTSRSLDYVNRLSLVFKPLGKKVNFPASLLNNPLFLLVSLIPPPLLSAALCPDLASSMPHPSWAA